MRFHQLRLGDDLFLEVIAKNPDGLRTIGA